MNKLIKKYKAVVIIPTYNEKENISRLLDSILLLSSVDTYYELHILIVDDSSPDGTAEIALNYKANHSNVHVIKDLNKEGLGTAYIRGFTYATEILGADVVLEMDADFSHNPSDIPRLISEIFTGKDFVIGSRYVDGGTIPKNWSKIRKANSKLGNIMARYVAGLGSVRDCTGGFRAIRTSLLIKINLQSLGVKGYAFQISLLHAAKHNHAKISEIPIHFIDREHGKSKIGFQDISEFILTTFTLRFSIFKHLGLFVKSLMAGMILGLTVIWIYSSQGLSISSFMLILSLLMILQGSFTLWWMLYAWNHPESIEKNKSPKHFITPTLSFSAIIPAKNEETVIGYTIQAISKIEYPEHLKETIIVCKANDYETIKKAEETIKQLGNNNIKVITFSDEITNKPHALNIGLKNSTKNVIVVFDAEDEPNKDIYHIANTIMTQNNVEVLQSGVQLMNYRSTWFSTLNVLEYFFWFKSTLHFFAKSGIIPLGGNTVFLDRNKVISVNGWDEKCLTEDADIGIRLSLANAKIQIVYDEKHTTREESPLKLSEFIKQRTRWNQGFLQVLLKGDWTKLKSTKARILAGYILVSPAIQALFFLYIPFSAFILIYYKLPVGIAMLSAIPLYILLLQIVVYNIGLFIFTRDYRLKYPLFMPLKVLFTFFPFQIILGISSARATLRMLRNNYTWEKTQHINAHRNTPDKTYYSKEIASI